MARNWTVREATRADDFELAELFRAVFGFDRGIDHADWKFRCNPAGDPIIAIAEVSGRIVGQYALWPTPLRLGQSIVQGAQSLDTMTHPDYRGQGMFTVLAEECMKYAAARGIQALYGFPNKNSQPGFLRRLDWDCTGEIPTWFRPLALSKHKSVPNWIGPIADLGAALLPKSRINNGVEISSTMPNPKALTELLETLQKSFLPCSVERTFERYIWRFDAASGMQYEWKCAYKNGHLLAFGVWGIDIRGGNAVLAELLGVNDVAIGSVLSAMLVAAGKAYCPLIHAVSNRSGVNKILQRNGFLKRSGLPLIVRKLTKKTLASNIHTHENWDIFGADLDTF
jgi:hypothetical protein